MVEYVAEISSNHNHRLKRAMRLIDAARVCGADSVKFQLFKLDQLFAPIALDKRPRLRERVHWELPIDYIPQLSNYAHDRGLNFSCTPFYMQAIDELYPYVDSYKVASYQVLWLDFLRELAKTGKPIALSVGMADWDEIDAAVEALADCVDLTILHCTSEYPTPIEHCNLTRINLLNARYAPIVNVGWSDHSVCREVILSAALRYCASMIEFHLDLDGTGEEYTLGHCWLPKHIKSVIDSTRRAELADGDPHVVSDAEQNERLWRTDPSDGLRPTIEMREMLEDV